MFDYDKTEDARALIAYVFTIAFVVGPIIFAIGFENFIIGLGIGLIGLLAQFGLIYLIKGAK